LPAKALRELLPGLRTRQDAEENYGKPISREGPGERVELAYPDSGIVLVFDSGYLSSVRKRCPEYRDMVLIPGGRFLLGPHSRTGR